MSTTLRNRIAAYFVLSAGILLGAVFVALYQVVQLSLYRHVDNDLDLESIEVHKSIIVLSDQFIFANPYEWREGEHQQVEVDPIFLQVVDTTGLLVRKSANLRENTIPFDPLDRTKTFRNAELANEPVRIVQLPIVSTQHRTLAYLSIAVSRKQIDVVLSDLGTVLLILYPICVAVMFTLSRKIAGGSLAPVHKIIATAEQITREDLSLRIDLPPKKDELYVLASTVNQLLERIESAIVRERKFTSDAAHELRTPLAALKGTLEVLIRKRREPGEYEAKIPSAIEEVNRLSSLVDRLLTLARYENGSVAPVAEPVNLKGVADLIIARLEPFFEAKRINLRLDIDGANVVLADRGMLEIIMENILSNAVKYSDDGGTIELSSRRNEGMIDLSISDHGVGMTMEQSKRMFNRFYRAEESRNSRTPGFGLGLAIVKSLADLQQVTIAVDSALGAGTTLTLRFQPAQSNINIGSTR